MSKRNAATAAGNRSSGVPMFDKATGRVVAVIVLLMVIAASLRGYLPGVERAVRTRPPDDRSSLVVRDRHAQRVASYRRRSRSSPGSATRARRRASAGLPDRNGLAAASGPAGLAGTPDGIRGPGRLAADGVAAVPVNRAARCRSPPGRTGTNHPAAGQPAPDSTSRAAARWAVTVTWWATSWRAHCHCCC